MRRAGAAIARIKNTEVQQQVAAKAVEERSPADTVTKQVRQRQGTPAKATQAQPFVQFKVRRGARVVIHGQLTGEEIIDALRAATDMAVAALEQARGEEEWEDTPDAGDDN